MSSLNKAKSSDFCTSSAAAGPSQFTACPRSSRRCYGLGAIHIYAQALPAPPLFYLWRLVASRVSACSFRVRRPYVFACANTPRASFTASQRFVGEGVQLAKVSGSVTTTCEKAFSSNRSSARLGLGACSVECIPKMICGKKTRLLSCPVERLAAARPQPHLLA